ncbi:MAG: protein translocase subunit SecF, partial [Planctomycetia bacterium]|nr:protein translocase subunit SecF [Planctomycetia bacterium]NDH94196.1 protein translocase subunit SecF [Planctomycetia bacterium]
GIISGTYSTIYIAAPIVLWLQGRLGAVAVPVARPANQPA